jgi:hypothetical protein
VVGKGGAAMVKVYLIIAGDLRLSFELLVFKWVNFRVSSQTTFRMKTRDPTTHEDRIDDDVRNERIRSKEEE